MWHPILDITPIIDYEVTKLYGAGSTTTLWYQGNQTLQYIEGCKLTFSCIFQLSSFPFDSHECKLHIGSHKDDTSKLKLMDLSIQYDSKTTNIDEEPIITNKLVKILTLGMMQIQPRYLR